MEKHVHNVFRQLVLQIMERHFKKKIIGALYLNEKEQQSSFSSVKQKSIHPYVHCNYTFNKLWFQYSVLSLDNIIDT